MLKETTIAKEKIAAAVAVKFCGDRLAIIADLRNSYTKLGDHPEWRPQFRKAISTASVHHILANKLAKFGYFIIYYSKIKPDRVCLLRLCEYPEDTTLCIISGVGEHNMTPWMIVHNIGHTYLSWHMDIKREIIKLLGLDQKHYSVTAQQAHLVHCAASRRKMIPNMNELIYELFTTWVWYGSTKSGNKELAKYCDERFPVVVQKCRGGNVWHRYRSPTEESDGEIDGLKMILTKSGEPSRRFDKSLGNVRF